MSNSMLRRVEAQLAKHTKAELLKTIARQQHRIEWLQQLPDLVPTNWLDNLLTGPGAVIPPAHIAIGPQHVETLLRAVKKRQQDRITEIGSVLREGAAK